MFGNISKDYFNSSMAALITHTCACPKNWGSFREYFHNSSKRIFQTQSNKKLKKKKHIKAAKVSIEQNK